MAQEEITGMWLPSPAKFQKPNTIFLQGKGMMGNVDDSEGL
jgi:hypothetical protein